MTSEPTISTDESSAGTASPGQPTTRKPTTNRDTGANTITKPVSDAATTTAPSTALPKTPAPATEKDALSNSLHALTVNKKLTVGYIGGSESAGQLTMKNAYTEGAKAANPDANVLVIMTGNTEDTALGKESALSMINQGADVIMHAADTTGLGVIEACVEKGVYCMGYGSDQHDLAPELMLTSVVEIVPPVIASQVDRIKDGSFGGVYKPGLGVGVELAELNADIIPADVVAEITQLIADVTNGVVVPTESYDK